MKDPYREQALAAIVDSARSRHAEILSGVEGGRLATFLEVLAGEREPEPMPPNRCVHRRMYMPGLSAQPYWPANLFPLADVLCRRFHLLRAEAARLLATSGVFRTPPGDVQVGDARRDGGRLTGVWNAWYLQRYFTRQAMAAVHTPIALRSLDGVAVSREALFSVVGPGTHIPPHSDELDFVITLYMPLVSTPDAEIVFDRTPRALREGECFAADSTFVHESYNASNFWRVILIVDLWHPDLSLLEVRVLGELMPEVDKVMRGVPAALTRWGR